MSNDDYDPATETRCPHGTPMDAPGDCRECLFEVGDTVRGAGTCEACGAAFDDTALIRDMRERGLEEE